MGAKMEPRTLARLEEGVEVAVQVRKGEYDGHRAGVHYGVEHGRDAR